MNGALDAADAQPEASAAQAIQGSRMGQEIFTRCMDQLLVEQLQRSEQVPVGSPQEGLSGELSSQLEALAIGDEEVLGRGDDAKEVVDRSDREKLFLELMGAQMYADRAVINAVTFAQLSTNKQFETRLRMFKRQQSIAAQILGVKPRSDGVLRQHLQQALELVNGVPIDNKPRGRVHRRHQPYRSHPMRLRSEKRK